ATTRTNERHAAMLLQRMFQLILVATAMLLLASVMSAMAATNIVARSGLGETSRSITVNDLKPSKCAGLNLSNLVTGNGNINGTLQNDLILGSAGADTIDGGGGNDCILGGGGNDTLIGGSGTNTLIGGGGTDICVGIPGIDTFDASCEG